MNGPVTPARLGVKRFVTPARLRFCRLVTPADAGVQMPGIAEGTVTSRRDSVL